MTRWLRSSFVVVGLMMVTALSGGPAFADSKVDLTEYLQPQPLPGDFKAFAFSDNASRMLEVLSVVPWKQSGWQAVGSVDAGLGDAAFTVFVVPGRKALIGEVAGTDLAVDFDKPKRLFKLRVVPGKLNRFDMRGTAFVAGAPVGPGTYRGTWQFLGFEDVPTPTVTWPMAARVKIDGSLRIKFRANGNIEDRRVSRTVWFAEGIGEVASEESVSVLLNGVLQAAIPSRTGWLESGEWKGMPIP